MDTGTLIIIVTTSLNLFVSLIDTILNGYTGWKNKTFHSSCCGLDLDYTSESESNIKPEPKLEPIESKKVEL